MIEDAARRNSGPIFIGGTGRSGTTALARLIGYHPRLFVLKWETQFIVAKDGVIDLVKKKYNADALERFGKQLKGPWFRRTLNAGKPNEYSAGLCDDLDATEVDVALNLLRQRVEEGAAMVAPFEVAREFIDQMFFPPTLRNKAVRWGEKTPRSLLYADYLYRIYPSMRFIHIIRDGRDVVSSMLEHGFWPIAPSREFPSTLPFRGDMTFEKAVAYWKETLALGRSIASRVPSGNYYEIKLETLAENGESSLRSLMDFIGEPYDPRLLEYDFSRANIGRWQDDLSEWQIDYFRRTAGEALKGSGYEL